MAAASGGNRPTYAASLSSLDYSVEDVKQFRTRWFQLVNLNKSMSGSKVKNIDEKIKEFASVRNCGMQIFERKLGQKMYKCYAYSISFDTNHPDFAEEDEKTTQVLKTGAATLVEIDSNKLDSHGEPNLTPVMGLEFQLTGGIVNNNFDVVIAGIKSRFKDYARFSETANSAVSFVDKKTAKLRIQCDSITKRPAGSYDITLASGRYFSVLARCFGIAPDENVMIVRDEKKKCYKCRSESHLVADCPLRRKNKKTAPTQAQNASTPKPTGSNTIQDQHLSPVASASKATSNTDENSNQPPSKRSRTQVQFYQAGDGGMETARLKTWN